MPFRALGWLCFIFLAGGLLLLILGGSLKPYGCAAILTSVTVLAYGLWMVARQMARARAMANQMMQRVIDEMERRKPGPGSR